MINRRHRQSTPTNLAQQLVREAVESAFRCGEWTPDDSMPINQLAEKSEQATNNLLSYIADLEKAMLSNA